MRCLLGGLSEIKSVLGEIRVLEYSGCGLAINWVRSDSVRERDV